MFVFSGLDKASGLFMATLRIKKSTINRTVVPVGICVLGSVLISLLRMMQGDAWLIALYATGAMAAYVMWRLTPWSDPVSRVASFGAVLLLMLTINHVLYLLDYVLSGAQFHLWPLAPSAPEKALIAGEAMTVIGTFLTVAAWRWFGGGRVSPSVLFDKGVFGLQVIVVAYVIAVLSILSIVLLRGGGGFGQLFPSIQSVGLLCCYLLPVMTRRTEKIRLALVMSMSFPFLAIALGSGMKENIIVSMLPAAVTAWQVSRSKIVRLALVIAGLVLVSIITSYVNYYRDSYWRTNTEVATSQALGGYLENAGNSGSMSVIGPNSGGGFLARNNASWYHGWAVSIADDIGHYPRLVFEPMVTVFVPRVLWPAKPRNFQGAEYTALVNGQSAVIEGGSSTATGLYAGMYLGGGWPAVVVGALLAGLLLAVMTRIVVRFGGMLGGGLYMFSLLPFIMRMSEEWPVNGLAIPVISGIYILILSFVFRIVARIAFAPAFKSPYS